MIPVITRMEAWSAAGRGVEVLAEAVASGRDLRASVPWEKDGLRSPFAMLLSERLSAESLLKELVRAVLPAEYSRCGLVVATTSGAISGDFEKWHARLDSEEQFWRQQPAINVASKLELAPCVTVSVACASGSYLASLDHLFEGERFSLQSTTAWTMDSSHLSRDFAGTVNRDVSRQQFFGRTDLILPVGKSVFEAGIMAMWRIYRYDGPVEDTRSLPSFAATPIGDFGFPLVELTEPAPFGILSLYAQHSYTGPINTRLGVRGCWNSSRNSFLASPSAGVAIPLPTATIPKASIGLYQRVIEDPVLIDPVYGNPLLLPERSWQGVLGVDQGLPLGDGGLLRVEGYFSYLDQLVVKPGNDTVLIDGSPYASVGWGYNYGVDMLFAARSERLSGAVNLSFNQAMRFNPLLICVENALDECLDYSVHPKEYQPITAGFALEYQLSPRWRLSSRYDYHRGRPISSVEIADPLAETIQLSGLNDLRLDDFHQWDLRAEWRKASPKIRWSVYLEVLNVSYLVARSPFLPIATVEDGELQLSALEHLPTRPFLGIRADF